MSAILLALSFHACAHEGHDDHDAAEEVALEPSIASEAAKLLFSSAHLEAVAVLDAQALLIYADDFQTNQPLSGLDVGVRSAGHLVKAQPSEPGLYRVPRDLLPAGDSIALDISVQAPGWHEQFAGKLTVVRADAHDHATAIPRWLPIGGGVLVALIAVVLFKLRSRRKA